MKLLKSVKTIPVLSAILSVGLLTLSIGGCGDATTGADSASGGSFTVSPGAYQRRQVKGPGKMTFSIKGVDMDLESDKQPIVYFYDSHGYGGGRKTGGFHGELRNYKLKYYDLTDTCVSESYYVQPKGSTPRWAKDMTRKVSIEWGADFVETTVDGIPFRKPGQVATTFTLGIGYTPTVPGWDNAVYTDIVWPKGSTEVK